MTASGPLTPRAGATTRVPQEMTRIIQVQKAYEAAAQIVQTADEMINTLLSMKQ